MNIRKGDKIKVLSGKDRGKTGKVTKAFPAEGKIVVEKINVVKKHNKAKGATPGERIAVEMPIEVSNVQLICSKCGKPSRTGKKQVGEKMVRICKKCEAEI
jgi:large subunit ribosomal protein L24